MNPNDPRAEEYFRKLESDLCELCREYVDHGEADESMISAVLFRIAAAISCDAGQSREEFLECAEMAYTVLKRNVAQA